MIQSHFLDLEFDEGDSVMADEVFRIEDILQNEGVRLNLPPFLHGDQFSEEDVRNAQEIAALRIHVERRIQRIKSYHIIDRPFPLSLVPLANQVWAICVQQPSFTTLERH